jgi:DNA-binding MarR family transcriptional regulator
MNLPTYIAGTTQAKAYRLLREHIYEVLSQYDLTPTYWSMLGIIMQAQDGVRQVEIAKKLHVKAPMVTSMAQQLQKRGLVQGVQNQFDARAKLLAVTPSGKKFVKGVEQSLHKTLDQLLHGITENDLVAYHKVLTTIIANDASLKSKA